MNQDDVLNAFREADALLEGHFILSSGRRSPVFLQKALVFARQRCPKSSVRRWPNRSPKNSARSVVTGPAVGGIIPGYEMARQLGARAMFAERDEDDVLIYKRGFEFNEDDRILIMEDIVTTGKSFRETVEALKAFPGEMLGGACIIDRSNGKADVGCDLLALARVDFPDYDPNDLPPELAKLEPVKPGSRRKF